MPLSGWLHINGVSVTTDVQQQQQHSLAHQYDYRTKLITSPNIPLISSANSTSMPYTTTIIPNDRQYHHIDNKDLAKKIFLDRQIKKAKSLPGLIKGTALSRQTSVQSNTHEDSVPSTLADNDDDISSSHQTYQQKDEIRRPRVSFSDYNKVQFIDHNNENSEQSTYRRQRQRSSKKLTTIMLNNPVSPPSIQHSQSLYRPLSRQQTVGNELNIKKQQLISSPRIHSSRITNLPDILNQSLPVENPVHEKYVLQREKTLFHFPEPAAELPINSTEISRENTRAGGRRPSPVQDYYDPGNDSGTNTMFNSSSISSSFTNRQRSSLRTISLRQQFSSANKTKLSNFLPNNPTPPSTTTATNSRRSSSLKHTIARNHSIEDDHNDIHNQNHSLTYENRPMTTHNPSKHLKRNYVINLNSKNSLNGNTTTDSNDLNRHYMKSNFQEGSSQRFQNLLNVVRPPYITNIHSTHHDLTSNPTNGSIRSSRTNSGRASHDYHITPNVVYV